MPRNETPADRTRRVEAATNPLKGAFPTPGQGKTATQIYDDLAAKERSPKPASTGPSPKP